jgi:exodeoxyribonuclease VII large subunit
MSLDSQSSLASRPVKEIYPVSRLVREARSVLEGSFPLIWVEGEISNLAMPASGHIYFTLKDEAAQVRCAMFRTRNRNLRFTPKSGQQVLLRVRVTLYEGRGEFQCVVEHMEEAGSGVLQRAYDALKHRLGDEGLFDSAHKKPLPSMPQSIGVVSSPDGAAVHDILTVLARRFPAVNVIVYPVVVQGNDSAKQITQAIKQAEKRKECDVLIVGRGGGSLEDLWSFNDEQLARTIFNCSLPIISAVGHEVDFTIADFVADVRAATPSAAAELAVPDAAELLNKVVGVSRRLQLAITHKIQTHGTTIAQNMQRVDGLDQRLHRAWQQAVKQRKQHVDLLSVKLTHPQAKMDAQQHRVAQLAARLDATIQAVIGQTQRRVANVSYRFDSLPMLNHVNEQQTFIHHTADKIHNIMLQKIDKQRAKLSIQMRTLAAVSPLSTLERGYSIATLASDNKVLVDSNQLEAHTHINVRLQKGSLLCKVIKINHD